MEFEKALSLGRARLGWARLGLSRRGRLPLLGDWTARLRPREEVYAGVQDVPVRLIVGSEDRTRDFSWGFFPVVRHLAKRWTRVRDLLTAGQLNEPLSLIEYGGYYWVRDGHHRVSVAKTHGIEFLSALVTRRSLPIRLPWPPSLERLAEAQEKLRFELDTGALSRLGDEAFQVRRPQTWQELNWLINVGHRSYFQRQQGRSPERTELIDDWNAEIYRNTLENIRARQLDRLYPERGVTDLFADLMRLWGEFPPDTWFEDVLTRFEAMGRRRRWWWLLGADLKRFFEGQGPARDRERALFYHVSRLEEVRPEAWIPDGPGSWWRFLHQQLVGPHYRWLRWKLGRQPRMEDLTASWYDDLFLPAWMLYQAEGLRRPFPAFYRGWMAHWGRRMRRCPSLKEGVFESFAAYRRLVT